MKTKKKPQRTCIVCRAKKDKGDLIRIVKNNENKVFYDPTGKANGRGAYICRDENCINKFLKKDSLRKAFRSELDSVDIQAVRDEVMKLIN